MRIGLRSKLSGCSVGRMDRLDHRDKVLLQRIHESGRPVHSSGSCQDLLIMPRPKLVCSCKGGTTSLYTH